MQKIDIQTFIKMFEHGAKQVSNNFEYINQLNIFPVPDGDTGTNMKITISGAFEYIKNTQFENLAELGRRYARGMLMNARGNSGVIFSQIIKGFTKSFPENKKDLSISNLIACFKDAQDVAYKSVVQPVEGTILTVIRVISEEIAKKEKDFKSMEELFAYILEVGKKALDNTPNLLPELKRAKVVDSGGYGLIQFLTGMENALLGKEEPQAKTKEASGEEGTVKTKLLNPEMELDESGHGYCTEFLLSLGLKADESQRKLPFSEDKLRRDIAKFTNSMVLVTDLDEQIVKLHVHTLEPDKVLRAGLMYGEFIKIKIDNMNMQVKDRKEDGETKTSETKINTHEILNENEQLSDEIKIIATAPSRTLGELIKENYHVSEYIDTGVYGNPSIGQFVKLINKCNSKKVIIVVDDTNIVLAAKEAMKHVKNHVKCELIVGRNFIELMAAISAFMPEENNIRTNVKTMTHVLRNTASACFSSSIKTIKYPHITVHKDDFIGIVDGKIIASETEILSTITKTMDILVKRIKKPELVIIIYGAKIQIREVRQIEKLISQKYGIYCEFISGGQKVYPYLIGVQ